MTCPGLIDHLLLIYTEHVDAGETDQCLSGSVRSSFSAAALTLKLQLLTQKKFSCELRLNTELSVEVQSGVCVCAETNRP